MVRMKTGWLYTDDSKSEQYRVCIWHSNNAIMTFHTAYRTVSAIKWHKEMNNPHRWIKTFKYPFRCMSVAVDQCPLSIYLWLCNLACEN